MRMRRWRLTHDRLEDIYYVTDLGKEIKCLQEVKEVYLGYLELYKGINEDLTDENMGYH